MAANSKHHFGGSWKIAYGDFITSMFALFLVLWILSFDEETRRAVENYFQGKSQQVIQGQRGVLDKTVKGVARTDPIEKASKDLLSINEFKKAMEKVREQLNTSAEPGQDPIRMDFDADGVRITAFDNAQKPFFKEGSSEITPFGAFVMRTLAYEIENKPFLVEVEGHVQTDEGAPSDQSGWDLSTQRALSAQSALSSGGVRSEQYYRVAGYGSAKPLDAQKPDSPLNRRIEIVVRPKSMEDVEKVRNAYPQP
jgi:chemotaxis protein MotB